MNNILKTLNNYSKLLHVLNNNTERSDSIGEESIFCHIQTAEEERRKCENIIQKIEDPYIKEIAILRYIKGKSWRGVAYAMGGYCTEDCYRKAVTRYFDAVGLRLLA